MVGVSRGVEVKVEVGRQVESTVEVAAEVKLRQALGICLGSPTGTEE